MVRLFLTVQAVELLAVALAGIRPLPGAARLVPRLRERNVCWLTSDQLWDVLSLVGRSPRPSTSCWPRSAARRTRTWPRHAAGKSRVGRAAAREVQRQAGRGPGQGAG